MSRPAAPTAAAAGWTPALATLLLLLAGVLVAYRDTGLAMVAIWSRSDTFAHAFLVPPIVAWLIWRKRRELAACAPRPTVWMLLPIGVASAAWLVGDLASANALAQLAFTALLVFVVVAVIGLRASRVIAFPLGFLFFSVPLGEFLMPQMMQWTADFTVLALRATGIPVYREGLQFVVPSGNWSVVEACSGIRYLIASIMVGTLFAYLNYQSLRRRLIFVGVSVAVPLVANWVRAYLIVLIGDLSGNVAAVSADHLIYGWVFFGIVITLMFVIGARWSEAPREPAVRSGASAGPGRASGVPSSIAWVAVGAAVFFLLPQLALLGVARGEREDAPQLAAPAVLGGKWGVVDTLPTLKPAFSGPAAHINRYYSDGHEPPVGLYIGYYRHQDYGRKLVSSENTVVTLHDPAWSVIETGSQRLEVAGAPLVVRTTLLREASHVAAAASARRLVWQFYWIDGTLTSRDDWAKLVAAYRRLLGRGDDGAVIVVHVDDPGDGSAPARLNSFLDANLAPLTRTLARTREAEPAPDAEVVKESRASRPRS